MKMDRRRFIKSGLILTLPISLPSGAKSIFEGWDTSTKVAIITDLHYDLMPDGMSRLEAFTAHAKKEQVNAIMQMGDFALPAEKNLEVIRTFNDTHPERLHVIGNHDTDNGHTKTQCLEQWGMPSSYYTKDINGITFIILDGNEKGSPIHKGGYASFIGPAQVAWLKLQLQQISGPIVIVSHQPLAGELAVDNAREMQDILSSAAGKILIALNGHTHVNSYLSIKGINYLHLNSASYFWVGEKYKHDTYPENVRNKYPIVDLICPYKEPLFATLTIDPKSMTINITGKKSSWLGESPSKLGYSEMSSLDRVNEIAPIISDRKLSKKR